MILFGLRLSLGKLADGYGVDLLIFGAFSFEKQLLDGLVRERSLSPSRAANGLANPLDVLQGSNWIPGRRLPALGGAVKLEVH